jgi:hypothetical protein
VVRNEVTPDTHLALTAGLGFRIAELVRLTKLTTV